MHARECAKTKLGGHILSTYALAVRFHQITYEILNSFDCNNSFQKITNVAIIKSVETQLFSYFQMLDLFLFSQYFAFKQTKIIAHNQHMYSVDLG